MKTLYNRFIHRSIFYHPHILVKPKQLVTRNLRFFAKNKSKKTYVKHIQSVQGYQIALDVFETKPNNDDVIILIHGHFSDKTEFNLLVPELQLKGYDVAVYNVYGKWERFSSPRYTYGKMEREDLKCIIETLEHYPRIHLVGHSLGAAVVAEYTDTYSNPSVRTKTMVALYETLEQAIDTGMEQAPVTFYNFKIDAKKHMEHFSNKNNVNLYEQDMKYVLSEKDESHLLVFGAKDTRAPLFKTELPTHVIDDATHTNFFTSKRMRLVDVIDNHIQHHI